MESFLSPDNWLTLFMLIILQAVLGFDNLLYISLESKRAPKHQQANVRRFGIGLAIILRLVLLFAMLKLIQMVQDPILTFNWEGVIKANMNIHSMIVLIGGVFILYTATKEIAHMMNIEDAAKEERKPSSAVKVITWIVIMNAVFSFDSILSAMALTKVFWVMATAIVISGILMIWLADRVSDFLERNRMYEVLGLFILFVVGIMLLSDGGHIGHLELFGNAITPMSKTTFYFVIAVLVASDIVQSRYQKRLSILRQKRLDKAAKAEQAEQSNR